MSGEVNKKSISQMSKLHYVRIFFQRLQASTANWKDDEYGAYVRLLFHQADKGSIPKDLKSLSRIITTAKKNWPLVSQKFVDDGYGNLINEIMDEERNFCLNQSEQNRKNVLKRWEKNDTTVLPDNIPKAYENDTTVLQPKYDRNTIPITNNHKPIHDAADTISQSNPPPLTSEQIAAAANKVFKDKIWMENTAAGQSLSIPDLQKWMAQFNSSLAGDSIHDFSESKYKKMFGGWYNKQKSKGYQLNVNQQNKTEQSYENYADKLKKYEQKK